MKPWLILAAYKLEVEILLQTHDFQKVRSDHFCGQIGAYSFDLQICGQGKVQVALMGARELMKKDYEGVILVGSAGALCPQVQDWVFISECLEVDFKSQSIPLWKSNWTSTLNSEIQSCRIVSTEQTIVESSQRKEYASEYAAQAVAWESAGFYRLLTESHKIGFELRYISDREGADLSNFKVFKEKIKHASTRLPFYIQSMIENFAIHQKDTV